MQAPRVAEVQAEKVFEAAEVSPVEGLLVPILDPHSWRGGGVGAQDFWLGDELVLCCQEMISLSGQLG